MLRSMRINAPKGQKIICREVREGLWGGGEPRGLLIAGEVYTVRRTKVFKDFSLVILVEIPDTEFNTVLFEEVGERLDATDSPADLYYRGLEERRRGG